MTASPSREYGENPADWFLTAVERGNDDTRLDSRHADSASWTCGNVARPLIHGATYFRELRRAVERLSAGDLLLFTDWRGDPDERLDGPDSDVGRVFADAAARGASVYGLLWRSHQFLKFGTHQNRQLGKEIEAAGGHCLLDMRVPRFGSHHQKLVVLRHRDHPQDDVAFVGGIDLCHSRRDDARHLGDPQALAMAAAYGDRPPWHDVQLAVQGPAVGDVETVFRERWEDVAPLSRNPVPLVSSWLHGESMKPTPMPPQGSDPRQRGDLAIQLLRTYPRRRPGYPFARSGERSVAQGYLKSLGKASSLVYVEDQYLWSREVASIYAQALRREPRLLMLFVIPGYPEEDGRLSAPPNLIGRQVALEALRAAGGDRFAVYFIENGAGTPVYVHAKVCVVDDRWVCIGSDNTNRRSWTHDTELSAAIVDESSSGWVRSLRLSLAAEHLGSDAFASDLSDPTSFFEAFRASASALEHWHRSDRTGPRPTGHLRPFVQEPLRRRTRLWAEPVYKVVFDPDGRPRKMRRAQEF